MLFGEFRHNFHVSLSVITCNTFTILFEQSLTLSDWHKNIIIKYVWSYHFWICCTVGCLNAVWLDLHYWLIHKINWTAIHLYSADCKVAFTRHVVLKTISQLYLQGIGTGSLMLFVKDVVGYFQSLAVCFLIDGL